MSNKKAKETTENTRQPLPVRLPGFIVEEEIGLGDVIKQVTNSFGIRPCGGCERRAAMLNKWITFTGQPK